MAYLSDDFLLHSASARRLYHEHAAVMPILDYHCHLSPRQIAENMTFAALKSEWQSIVIGSVLIVAVALDHFLSRRK